MLLTVAAVGVAFLVGLAIAVGVESSTQDRGWRGVAEARRELAERRRALDDRERAITEKQRTLWAWEGELVAAAESKACPVCELLRLRGKRLAD